VSQASVRSRRRTPAALASIGVALLVLTLLALRIRDDRPPAWDGQVLRFLSPQERGHAVSSAFSFIVDVVGDYRGLWSAALLIAALLVVHRARPALVFALTLFATLATVSVLKPSFVRPPLLGQRQGYFPSTHAAGAMVICLAVARDTWTTRWRWPALALSIATVAFYGAALVSTRNHYPSDVVSGWCIAVIWTAAFVLFELATERVRPRTGLP
jgi:membrane-associated phospholipid phosphatase